MIKMNESRMLFSCLFSSRTFFFLSLELRTLKISRTTNKKIDSYGGYCVQDDEFLRYWILQANDKYDLGDMNY